MSYLKCLSSTVVAAALLSVSCSTLFSNRKSEVIEQIEEVENIAIEEIEDLEPQIDSLSQDYIVPLEEPVAVYVEEEEEEDELDSLFFEESQTTAMMIDEYKNYIVDDLTIDLSSENSFYPADGHVTSRYGWRSSRMHAGIDLKAQVGDNLYAAFDGVVRLAKYYSSFGNCIIIRHHNGLETLYAHATKLLVKVNDHVKAGDIIAYAGSTGRSTGSHLHFEVRVAGNHFNPELVLDTENRKIKDANLYITMRNGRLFASNNDSKQEREDYIIEQLSIRYYTVKSGDVLSRIAANNGTTVATICRLNGIKSTSILRIGQRLIVRDGIKPGSTTTTTTTTKSTQSSSSTTASSGTTTYVVKKGDTLGAIAKRNGTTVNAICSLNGITSRTTLQIGQRLKLSGTAAASSSSASSSSSSSPEYYKVRKGDTLGAIALRNGTTVSKLCSLNGISSTSTLSINQRLRVR